MVDFATNQTSQLMPDRSSTYQAPCHLIRIAAADNVWRYYTLALWPDLFGGTTLVREWGRIGQDGTVMRQHFAEHATAERELDRIARSKVRRGYRPAGPQERQAEPSETPPLDAAASMPRHLSHARNARPAASGGRAGERFRAITRPAMRGPQITGDRRSSAAACRG